jgi:hypothetical protein
MTGQGWDFRFLALFAAVISVPAGAQVPSPSAGSAASEQALVVAEKVDHRLAGVDARRDVADARR